METETYRPTYTVRQTRSGYTGTVKYLVFTKGHRVSVHAHITRESAQSDADDLNVGALVKDYADDPRPYEVRKVEARETYRRLTGR